jgi:hypothetical protein
LSKYASKAIKSRIDQLWASQTHLALNLNVSKQVLAYRIKSADSHTCYWPYWCKLLLMESTWLERPVQDRERPDVLEVTMALVKYGRTYRQHLKKGGRPKVKP